MIQKAYFGGGCFWCTEAVFQSLKGVVKVTPGYAGGLSKNPNYLEVSSGETGHAEVVEVKFDPKAINYDNLLTVFWNVHNPTSLNRQGNDIGSEYRSLILYVDDVQKVKALRSLARLRLEKQYNGNIVTEIKKLVTFYEAESYHKDYYRKHQDEPYCQIIINPKLDKLKKQFSRLVNAE
ncbi:peptide-methionine (S)-S-oxide reductase MsrA [Patescibacteria group bacterium]|nr:peptide-methionine (S)-S-oxide reductase MsrA [Patescibacteria group bacterium]